jgi:hypothetical protein
MEGSSFFFDQAERCRRRAGESIDQTLKIELYKLADDCMAYGDQLRYQEVAADWADASNYVDGEDEGLLSLETQKRTGLPWSITRILTLGGLMAYLSALVMLLGVYGSFDE